MNAMNQGIPLGRWFGIHVVISWAFFLAVWWIMSQFREAPALGILMIVLLFGTVLLHEFGHALACLRVGGDAHYIILGPLGGTAFVQPPNNAWAWLVTTICGPLVNAILWPLFWAISHYGLPMLATVVNPDSAVFDFIAMVCYAMMFINRGLLLFNLIPSYPMDGGRILQILIWLTIGYRQSLLIAGMVGTVAGGAFVLLGLGMHEINIPYVDFSLGGRFNPFLLIIGIMCMTQSWGIYQRAQEIRGWRKN